MRRAEGEAPGKLDEGCSGDFQRGGNGAEFLAVLLAAQAGLCAGVLPGSCKDAHSDARGLDGARDTAWSQFVMFNISEKERGREISCPFKNSVL